MIERETWRLQREAMGKPMPDRKKKTKKEKKDEEGRCAKVAG